METVIDCTPELETPRPRLDCGILCRSDAETALHRKYGAATCRYVRWITSRVVLRLRATRPLKPTAAERYDVVGSRPRISDQGDGSVIGRDMVDGALLNRDESHISSGVVMDADHPFRR